MAQRTFGRAGKQYLREQSLIAHLRFPVTHRRASTTLGLSLLRRWALLGLSASSSSFRSWRCRFVHRAEINPRPDPEIGSIDVQGSPRRPRRRRLMRGQDKGEGEGGAGEQGQDRNGRQAAAPPGKARRIRRFQHIV